MFVDSEISPQHHGEHHIAEQMILQSKLGGAEAVKVQQYDPEQFNKPESHAMSKEQLRDLSDFGDAQGIPVFATAFAPKFLDWCVDLDLKYLKMAKMRVKTRVYYGQYLPLDRIDLRLDFTANNQQFEAADVGVAVFSTIVYERLFCGYKSRILNLTNPAFPLAGSSLGRSCVRSEAALEGAMYECAGLTHSEDFRQLGITAFRWDSFPQIGAK